MKKIFLLTLFLITSYSYAAETVKIAFTDIVNNHAKFYIKEIETIYRKIGVEPIISVYPDSRVSYLFEKGEVDALGEELEIYEEVNSSAIKIDVPILESVPFRLFIMRGKRETISKDKKRFVIATLNCLGCKKFSSMYKVDIDAFVTDYETGLNMLRKGRADMMIATSIIVSKARAASDFTTFNDQKYSPKIYHFISESKKHLQLKLTKEILNAKKRGAFNISNIGKKK